MVRRSTIGTLPLIFLTQLLDVGCSASTEPAPPLAQSFSVELEVQTPDGRPVAGLDVAMVNELRGNFWMDDPLKGLRRAATAIAFRLPVGEFSLTDTLRVVLRDPETQRNKIQIAWDPTSGPLGEIAPSWSAIPHRGGDGRTSNVAPVAGEFRLEQNYPNPFN